MRTWLALMLATLLLFPTTVRANEPGTAAPAEPKQLDAKRIEELTATIEGYREGAAKYDKALDELFTFYIEADRREDAARLALEMAIHEQNRMLRPALERTMETARRFTDEYARVSKEINDQRSEKWKFDYTPNHELAEKILQRRDSALREKSLSRLTELLRGDTVSEQMWGLSTLYVALPAKFDREPFRQLVLPLLKSEAIGVRHLAVWVLPGVSDNLQDLELLLPLVNDPAPKVRAVVGSSLIQLGQGEHADRVAPALIKLLRDEDKQVVESTIKSMWGQYRTPELNEVLIELSNDLMLHGPAIYCALSPQQVKSVAVCRRLVAELSDHDWNNSGRAAWGLSFGVVPEAVPLVEAGLLLALPEETNPRIREPEFEALEQVATEKSRTFLEQVAASEAEQDATREQARKILAKLDAAR